MICNKFLTNNVSCLLIALIRQLFAYTCGCGAEFLLRYLIVTSKSITHYVYNYVPVTCFMTGMAGRAK